MLEREIHEREFVALNGGSCVNDVVAAAVELFLAKISALAEKGKTDVFVFAPPSLLDAVEAAAARSGRSERRGGGH